VTALRPDAASKTFVLGEFGRLLKEVDPATLPGPVQERGEALVRAVDAVRDGRPPESGDDLDDPWGRGDQVFSRVADEIQATVGPLAKILIGK
jgi:protein-tyrosine phosphatase